MKCSMQCVKALTLALGLAAMAAQAATLRSLGAVGDDRTDDTAALQRAFSDPASGDVLDGEGRTYRVQGSLRIERDLTLRNLQLRQDADDPKIEGPNNTRTLFGRGKPGAPLKLVLSDITVDRGRSPYQGSPDDAAGIWLDHVADSRLERITVTGNGRGAGLLLAESQRVVVEQIRVHDMAWAPCLAQTEGLPYERIRGGLNEYMMLPMSDCRRPGEARQRIREPLAGIIVVRSQDVTLRHVRVERLLALFNGAPPWAWQTNGINLKSDAIGPGQVPIASRIRIEDAILDQTWQGIDANGQPLTDVRIDDAHVRDALAFGIKLANGVQGARVTRSSAQRAGMAGFVVAGSGSASNPFPATHDVLLEDCEAIDTGIRGEWTGQATVAGFRVMEGGVGGPRNVVLRRVRAIGTPGARAGMTYGVQIACNGAATVEGAEVRSAVEGEVHVSARRCR